MPPKRPTPLSDELFAPPMLLGSARFGAALPGKSAFADVRLSPAGASQEPKQPVLSKFVALSECTSAAVAVQTPTGGLCVIPPTPSPLHAWEPHRGGLPRGPPSAATCASWPSLGLLEPAPCNALPTETILEHDVPGSSVRQCTPGDSEGDSDEDEDEDALESLHPVREAPRQPPGVLHPSMGSEGHASSTCKRCCFFPRGRCANGYKCEFCHYEHEKRKRKNKTKKRTAAAGSALPSAGRAGVPAASVGGQLRGAPGPLRQAAARMGMLGVGQTAAVVPGAGAPAAQLALSVRPAGGPATYMIPVLMQVCQPQCLVLGRPEEMAGGARGTAAAAPYGAMAGMGYCLQSMQQPGFQVVRFPPGAMQNVAVEAAAPLPPQWAPQLHHVFGAAVPQAPMVPMLPGVQVYGALRHA